MRVIMNSFAAIALLLVSAFANAQATQDRPNILLVLLDDVGFMDFGAYGSDTATPNIDALGQSGAMFTRYYTSPLCAPSRASLMTGQDNHVVGVGTLAEVLTPEMRNSPAYSMTWEDSQNTIATELKSAGYQTFVTGKWGIGGIGANLPHRFGFDRSWVLDATGASNYAQKPYLPMYKEAEWYEDGERVSLPGDFYSSRNIVDKMIDYLDESDADKPFFSYLSFMAVHIPVQVPEEYVEKYNGVFDRGWDVMREERLQRAIELGLVPESTTLAGRAYNGQIWGGLDAQQQAYSARTMQVNAGMMEAADFHFGRLLDYLDAKGELDNTLIIVTSDNGPEGGSLGSGGAQQLWMAIEGWDQDFDNLGQPGSMAAIGQNWASVSAAPFHLFKFNASEGGTRVPMVASGPGVESLGFVNGRSQVADIAPTILEAAGVEFSADQFYGRSLMPVLSGAATEIYGERDSFGFEVSGTAALYRGNWKLTKTPEPYGDGEWHLYDLAVDSGETTDLGQARPELLREMLMEYDSYGDKVGLYDLEPGYSAQRQLAINLIQKTAINYWYLPTSFFLLLAVLLYGLVRLAITLGKRLRA